ncbi:MAG TPA: transcriptional repressor [Anaerolineae bacterium]|nr:transcriptional repressor [Anaerolineae bacterium]HID84556.1 transcriptional repressor [Anaerolineales bacterium]HIQ08884.1 transcriptional repressor [Anaerolineaceae bacterium]
MTSKAVPEVQERLEQWWARLQAQGYRRTLPREAVTRVLAASDRVLEVMEVFQQARAYYPRLGLVTVYRTLDKLTEVGLVQRVHRPDGCGAYVAVPEGHVHLALCSVCGRVYFFKGDDISALMAEVARQSGFRLESHWLQFFGLCPECQQNLQEVP